jgi:proton-dependent oligopeptide transporter, POT family
MASRNHRSPSLKLPGTMHRDMQTSIDTTFFGHPRGLSTLFFTELWERFSYYGMRALLILFMTAPVAAGGLQLSVATAGVIYGTYTALVYFMALPGGWVADRILGQRCATLYGGLTIMCGHISLAVPSIATFYFGLTLLVIGTGLLKPNIAVMVGTLYDAADLRRDAGFSIFYMGINVGAFIAPLACGWLAQSDEFKEVLQSAGIARESSWHWGFGMAAVGMFLGLAQYLCGWKYLDAAGAPPLRRIDSTEPAKAKRQLRIGLLTVTSAIALVAVVGAAGGVHISPQGFGATFGYLLLLTTVAFFIWLFFAGQWTRDERKQLLVVMVLFVGASIFFSVFEQGGSTLTLFAGRHTDNAVLSYRFPASWFQALNPLLVILLTPFFAWLWIRLGRRDPSSPTKFTIGLVLVALGFGVLIYAGRLAEQGVLVSPVWLVATYLLHTLGELCLVPVGLNAMTKLAPARIAGLTMGVWYLAYGVGNYLGGHVASLFESLSLSELFRAVTLYAFGAAVLMALLIRPIRRMLARAS